MRQRAQIVGPSTPLEQALVSALATDDYFRPDPIEHDALPTISGSLLSALVTRPEEIIGRTPSMLMLADLHVSGPFALDGVTVATNLGFERCTFERECNIDRSSVGELLFVDCEVPGFSAFDTHCTGNLLVRDCVLLGAINLEAAVVDGFVVVRESTLLAENERSISASRLGVTGGLQINDCRLNGMVDLAETKIAGGLLLRGADIVSRDTALSLQEAQVSGSVRIADSTLRGMFNLTASRIVGSLSIENSKCSAELVCIAGGGAHISGDVTLGRAFEAFGMARFDSSTVDGEVLIRDARFAGEQGSALLLHHITVGRSLQIGPGCHFTGRLSLSVSSVGGHLGLESSVIYAPDAKHAIHLDGATLGGGLFIKDVTCNGNFHAARMSIGAVLQIESTIVRVDRGGCMVFDGTTVDGSVYVHDGCSINGGLSLSGVTVEGQVSIKDSNLTGHGDEDALAMVSATVRRTVLVQGGTVLRGHVDLSQARIGPLCSFNDADLGRTLLFNLSLTEVAGSLTLLFARPPLLVDLSGASAMTYVDRRTSWAMAYRLDGFTYERCRAEDATERQDRVRWIERHVVSFAPQPYQVYAAALEQDGRTEDARYVLMKKARRAGQQGSRLGRAGSFASWALVGNGYRPGRAIVWLLGSLLFAWLLFAASHPDHIVQTHPDDQVPGFSALGYAADVLMPVIDLKQADAWTATGVARELFWFFTLWGWVLTTALAAAVTAMVVRE